MLSLLFFQPQTGSRRPTFDTGGLARGQLGPQTQLPPVVASKHEEFPVSCAGQRQNDACVVDLIHSSKSLFPLTCY